MAKRVCVVGIGYVGITLSLALAERGFCVVGVDKDEEVCNLFRARRSPFKEAGINEILNRRLGKGLEVAEEIPDTEFDVFVICVGTPIDKETKEPVLEYLIRASEEVAERVRAGNLVIIRSTVPVGTCREIVWPILKGKGSILLSCCPERSVEGAALKELACLPQIVGGIDEESLNRSVKFFKHVTDKIITVSSIEASEMVKLLDNTYRDVHFAYANEVAGMAEVLGLDAVELISAANKDYPRTNIPVPGYVGGTCLEKDPYLLMSSLKKFEYTPVLIKEARRIHERLFQTTFEKIVRKLESVGKRIEDSKIFITGFAFKGQPQTSGIRGSAAKHLLDNIRRHTDNGVYGHDFAINGDELRSLGVIPAGLEDGFKDADIVAIMNNHKSYYDIEIEDYVKMMKKPAIFFDSWHIFNKKRIEQIHNILYGGIGIE